MQRTAGTLAVVVAGSEYMQVVTHHSWIRWGEWVVRIGDTSAEVEEEEVQRTAGTLVEVEVELECRPGQAHRN